MLLRVTPCVGISHEAYMSLDGCVSHVSTVSAVHLCSGGHPCVGCRAFALERVRRSSRVFCRVWVVWVRLNVAIVPGVSHGLRRYAAELSRIVLPRLCAIAGDLCVGCLAYRSYPTFFCRA